MKSNPLNIRVAGLELRNPTALASGIFGYSAESWQSITEAGAGAVVTKSVGLTPRVGYANPTVVQANCGLINAMGLPNPGITELDLNPVTVLPNGGGAWILDAILSERDPDPNIPGPGPAAG